MSVKASLRKNLDLKIVIVAAAYFLSALLGYYLAFDGSDFLPAWPPAGVALALLLLLGRKSWPGITMGALLANIMAFWNVQEAPPQMIIILSTVVALAYTIQAILGNFLIKKWINDPFPFLKTTNAFRFLFITVLVAFIGTAIIIGGFWFNDMVNESSVIEVAVSLWVGNTVGILLFTPFVLSLFRKVNIKLSKEKVAEIGLFILAAVTLGFLYQFQIEDITIARALPFLVIPFILWLAFRFNLIVSLSAVVISSLAAIYLTIHNMGPFVLDDDQNSMLLLQVFIGMVSITTLILATTVKERNLAQEKIMQFNENLEEMVRIRTKALNSQIDTRIKAEEKLQNTNDELVKRNEELDRFVYSVSHDLRAPIASMLGIVNLAKKEDDMVMKDMYFDMLNGSAEQLDNFISEILDQSQNARSEVKYEKVVFKDIIDETFEHLKFASPDGREVKRNINVDKKAFKSDPWRIKVILNNLISNSIRYRNGKSPVIDVDVKVKNGSANIIVKDNGRGIPKEHLDKVCNMFYRATDDGAGSGLGLYIVKEAVDKLGGELKIDSKEGKGTTVTVTLPEEKKMVSVLKELKEEKLKIQLTPN